MKVFMPARRTHDDFMPSARLVMATKERFRATKLALPNSLSSLIPGSEYTAQQFNIISLNA